MNICWLLLFVSLPKKKKEVLKKEDIAVGKTELDNLQQGALGVTMTVRLDPLPLFWDEPLKETINTSQVELKEKY